MINLDGVFQEGMRLELGRILNKDLFLFLLDYEVKRSRRYQNFLSILILELIALPSDDGMNDLRSSCQMLATLVLDEMREADIFGVVGENRLVVLLPYADASAGNQAKARFESFLEYGDFRSRGCEVKIHQVSYPMHGTDTHDLTKKVLGAAPI